MPDLLELNRRNLEAVYGPDNVVSVPESRLSEIGDPDTREAMRTLGLPFGKNPMFGLYRELGEKFDRLGQPLEWQVGNRFSKTVPESDTWIPLFAVFDDTIALDPESGKVHCLPQDGDIYLFSSSFRAYLHFMYIYEAELPHFDVGEEDPEEDEDDGSGEGAGEDAQFDPEGSRERVENAMREVDPVVLDNPESHWHRILEFIVDPEVFHW